MCVSNWSMKMKLFNEDHDPDRFANRTLLIGLVYTVVVLVTILAISLALHAAS
jgi:hypothetical protein